MIRVVYAVNAVAFCASFCPTASHASGTHSTAHHTTGAQHVARAEPPEGHGRKPGGEDTTQPTGVRHGIDWGTLDIAKGREHTSAVGIKFLEYDVRMADSPDVIQVLWALEADHQDEKLKYQEDGKTPLGLEITYNCVSYVFNARGIRCKGETRLRDFWIANSSFAKVVHHNAVEEPDDRKAKAALLDGKRVFIVYKSLDGVMQHIAVMKTMDVPFGVATSDSTCDSKPGAYALARDVRIDAVKHYFSETLLYSFYVEK